MSNNILEISKRASKGGRVPIKIALLKIHDDPNESNSNGIHWDEAFVINAIDSVISMPICAEFCDDDKSTPLGHGLTGVTVDENGIQEPVFEDSETVGIIETASIQVINVNGTDTKLLVGEGYLFNQRYPGFVRWVRKNHALNKIDTSIEIMGLEKNDKKIIYLEDSPSQKFRTPKEFDFTGTAILSIMPADTNAVVLEVAEKLDKEENFKMDEKELKQLIVDTITETNSAKADSENKITELNNLIADKDSKISELNNKCADLEKESADKDEKIKGLEAKISEQNTEINQANCEKLTTELNAFLAEYSDEEQKFAESEINSYRENPLEGNLDVIKSKICVGIVEKQKTYAKNLEVNSKQDVDVDDIFSEMCSITNVDDEDDNIF